MDAEQNTAHLTVTILLRVPFANSFQRKEPSL